MNTIGNTESTRERMKNLEIMKTIAIIDELQSISPHRVRALLTSIVVGTPIVIERYGTNAMKRYTALIQKARKREGSYVLQ